MVLLATRSPLSLTHGMELRGLPSGRPPAGFLFVSSPKDQSGQWTVVRDGTNSVLGQLRQGPSGVQLAVVEGLSFADLVLSVRVRLLEGARSAGVVWHYRDADNYYLARLDLREQDVRIYRVVAGNRTRLEEDLDRAFGFRLVDRRRAEAAAAAAAAAAADATEGGQPPR